jgi:hypothetical protein
LPPLLKRYAEAQRRIASGKVAFTDLVAETSAFNMAAGLLARFSGISPADLAELAMTVEARHHSLFAPALPANRAEVVPLLTAALGQRPAQDWAGVVRGEVPFDGPVAGVAGSQPSGRS